jgi:ribosomal protein L3 glutamine methyltransferase
MPAKKSASRKSTAKVKVVSGRSAASKPAPAKKSAVAGAPEPATVAQLISFAAERFAMAELWFGHGTDNAVDEAAELVFFAAGLRHDMADEVYGERLEPQQRAKALELIERRIRERVPAAYLTHRMWFAGHEFYVNEHVLVPRSPIAELIEARFRPWIDASKVHRILDIGTGSGCIAIAAALAFPKAKVDAADISADALAVTRTNIERHAVQQRVRAVQSDVFDALKDERYDVIVSNPPYVGDEELAGLPEEYRREPALGLHGGRDGLDIVHRIIDQAAAHLQPQGILIVEVGNSEETLVAARPRLPFTWLEFERGGGGVFVLTREQLVAKS